MARQPDQPLVDRLYRAGVISGDQLRIARTEQRSDDDALERILVRFGFVSEAVLRDYRGEVTGHEAVDLSGVVPEAEALACLSKAVAQRLGVAPLSYSSPERLVTVAMADPDDLVKLDRLRVELGGTVGVRAMVAGEREIADAIERFYGYELSVDGILQELEAAPAGRGAAIAASGEYGQPIVRLIDAILADAVKRGASDVHFEPEPGFVRIRYRIDGVLRQVRSLHGQHWPPMSVRLKVMADLNIAETRAPQDGRTMLTVAGRSIDFRVSVVRTIHGENIVLRILDRRKGLRRLDELGFAESTRDALELMRARPDGLILVTGPTGSGKTTTLYALIAQANREDLNIVTLEDPVEHPVPMVRQSAVNEAAGLDFANGIRHLMRQDPDVMLVGEIRDEATATMAYQAAMTGHQVYATLHTHSALGAFPRLLDIGIRPDVLAGHTAGVMGQRLLRRLCPDCKRASPPTPFERRLMGHELATEGVLYRPGGCTRCSHQGYRGRFAIAEVVRLDTDLEELVAQGAPRKRLAEAARPKGCGSLPADGLRHVRAGETSLAELTRVVDLTSEW